MADETTRVVDLPVKATSNISLADYLMGIDAAEGYQMLIGDLARKIIETYTGSSLAGSAQTLKAALDGLNTKVGNASMGTTATSVTGAIAEHESDINGTNGINAKIGNTTMGTTATTLTGAIAEHEEDISELNSKTSGTLGASTYTSQYTYYVRRVTKYAEKKVHIELTCSFNIDIPTARIIAIVPTGFRPNATNPVPAIIVTNDGTVVTGFVDIAADGNITQGHTSYARKVYVDAWYDI